VEILGGYSLRNVAGKNVPSILFCIVPKTVYFLLVGGPPLPRRLKALAQLPWNSQNLQTNTALVHSLGTSILYLSYYDDKREIKLILYQHENLSNYR
jgi:hypothetical protein